MIKSINHETWNGQSKQLLRLLLGDNEASFTISCSNFTFKSFTFKSLEGHFALSLQTIHRCFAVLNWEMANSSNTALIIKPVLKFEISFKRGQIMQVHQIELQLNFFM